MRRGSLGTQRSLVGLAVLVVAACGYDYGKFDASPADGGAGGAQGGGAGAGGQAGSAAGGTAGASGAGGSGAITGGGSGGTSGGAGGTSGGGTGGATGGSTGGGTGGATGGSGGATGGGGGSGGATGGSGGTSACGTGEKLCGASCVKVTDPATGCGATSCSACALANATAKCDGTGPVCQVDVCGGTFANCDNQAGNGCEQDLSKSDNQHCGSCANNCTFQGHGAGFSCSAFVCRCTNFDQCREGGSGTAACNSNGRCSCSNTECNPGESCRKVGAAQTCSCNGGAACVPGQTCCQTPAACRDLQTDAQNCGACGRACASGKTCVAGVCT